MELRECLSDACDVPECVGAAGRRRSKPVGYPGEHPGGAALMAAAIADCGGRAAGRPCSLAGCECDDVAVPAIDRAVGRAGPVVERSPRGCGAARPGGAAHRRLSWPTAAARAARQPGSAPHQRPQDASPCRPGSAAPEAGVASPRLPWPASRLGASSGVEPIAMFGRACQFGERGR